jgi:protein tyrosine phosphatase (PTP) superfamily phosphohydrolase (DUF442 family)
MAEQPETMEITREVEVEIADEISAQLSHDQFEAIVEETLEVLVERHPDLTEEDIPSSSGLEGRDEEGGLESPDSTEDEDEDKDGSGTA